MMIIDEDDFDDHALIMFPRFWATDWHDADVDHFFNAFVILQCYDFDENGDNEDDNEDDNDDDIDDDDNEDNDDDDNEDNDDDDIDYDNEDNYDDDDDEET